MRTTRGCRNECWFVKQIPLSDWRGHAAGTERVFIVLAATAADNARMSEHVYKKIEIVGSSPNGMEEAVHNALSRASKTIRNMRWFEVTETRGYIDDGKVDHWQVTLKMGLRWKSSVPVARLPLSDSTVSTLVAATLPVPAPIGTIWRRRKSRSRALVP